jgi:solute:Na+ symporter, SSS family
LLHPSLVPAQGLRLDLGPADHLILVTYFAVVLFIGFTVRRSIRNSEDFFLSGRSLPAWITGLAFISANLGATEIFGMAANGAKYGISTVHYYWIGAVPAMIFLALVMMPFYYGSKVRSVPEYLRRRFNPQTHLFNAGTFAVSAVAQAGINLFAFSVILEALLGWPKYASIIAAGVFVLIYITLGGLSSAIYNEVLQFFVILAGLIPLTFIGLKAVGGWGGLTDKVSGNKQAGEGFLHAWQGTGIGNVTNPIGSNWLVIAMGLGFVLSFGYWTTNFAEVQRALSARNMSAARRTPIVGAFPKLVIPFLTVIPGLIALAMVPGLGKASTEGQGLTYNDAIPALMERYLPSGVLGIAVTGLLAAFMAGMAANISSFNTVFTYDIWQDYVRKDRPDGYYLRVGRIVTVCGVVGGILTAFIADRFNSIMDYLQLLFSFFNAPLFATFILGLFWRRMSGWGGFWGLVAGTAGAAAAWGSGKLGWVHYASDSDGNFKGAIVAFVADIVVSVVVTWMTRPQPVTELQGLVYGLGRHDLTGDAVVGDEAWYRSPIVFGLIALALSFALYIPFI